MPRQESEMNVFYVPPNFIEGGTLFGGALKLRNVLEAGVLCLTVGLPVLRLPVSLTVKIIILCLTALPLGIAAVIGVFGESLSSFALNFCRFFRSRRIVGLILEKHPKKQSSAPKERARTEKRSHRKQEPLREDNLNEVPEEFDCREEKAPRREKHKKQKKVREDSDEEFE